MKTTIKLSIVALSAIVLGAGCTKMDELASQGGSLNTNQVKESSAADPSRADALYVGMYTKLGEPDGCGYAKPDDFGMIMIGFSGDLEAADVIMPNSNYNWFSVCGELSSRNPNYRNPYIRYKICYDVIKAAHDVLAAFDATSEDPAVQAKIGEAHAIRAFAYLNLVPYFQFSYTKDPSAVSVPLVTESTLDPANNPRASLKDLYDLILFDLDIAIKNLNGWKRSDKSKIDQNVAYGLRARAYLNMGMYAEAAADAEKAMAGYTPATMEEVSHPFLMSLDEHNWIWGYDMTEPLAQQYIYANSSAWLRSFSGDGYSPACQTYAYINNLLYNKIPATDVRKGWWVDENLQSPLLEGLTWGNLEGQAIASGVIKDIKEQFLPLTNVKFGCLTLGTTLNSEDWCWMRAEEMILIQVEGLARSGKVEQAKEILTDFVRQYRDPMYDAAGRGLKFEDEIWFQRRVELWGEGFSNNDTRRLGKPLVRFHKGEESNQPDAFRFNMAADDGWWLLRFPQTETDNNSAIVDNAEGKIPAPDQLGELRDGVTD